MLLSASLSQAILLALATVPAVCALPQPQGPIIATATPNLHARDIGTWETALRQIPLGPRRDHAVSALGLEVVILGGTTISADNKPSTPLRPVEAYAPLTDSWRPLANLPIAVTHANLASVHGKLYMLGGMTGDKGMLLPTGASYKFSPFANTWEAIPEMPPATKRGAAAVCAWKDLVIVAGGVKRLNTYTGARTTSSKVSAFNTINRSWIAYPDLPEGGRDHAGGAIWNNTIYVVGGQMGGRGNVKGDVFALNLNKPETGWKKKASMLVPRAGASMVEINDKLYVFGGNTQGSDGKEVTADVEVYDPERDEWESAEDMPLPRSGTGAAIVLGEVYLPGGADDVQGGTATKTMQGFIPKPRGRAQDEL